MDNYVFCLYIAFVTSNWFLTVWDRNKGVVRCSIVDTIIKSEAWWQNNILQGYKTFLGWSYQLVFWCLTFGFLLMDLQTPVVLTHFPTATHFTWSTVDRVVHCSCAVFQFWSYPRFGRAFATAHPPLLSGSARGIFLVVLCSILYLGERGLLGHSLHFQSFLNVNCTVHSSQISDMQSRWKMQDFRLPWGLKIHQQRNPSNSQK